MTKKNVESFHAFSDYESQNYLASNWPKGKLTAKRFDSNSILYKFILCLSMMLKVISGQIYILAKNTDIDQASELLEEWETSVKIPQDIPRQDTLEARRRAVKQLKSKIPVYNINSDEFTGEYKTTFESYVYNLTGINVEITTAKVEGGGSDFPLEFPVPFGIGQGKGNFLFIIKVPLDANPQNNFFPIPFPIQFFVPKIPDATIQLLDLVLDRVIPAFGDWIYEAVIN